MAYLCDISAHVGAVFEVLKFREMMIMTKNTAYNRREYNTLQL